MNKLKVCIDTFYFTSDISSSRVKIFFSKFSNVSTKKTDIKWTLITLERKENSYLYVFRVRQRQYCFKHSVKYFQNIKWITCYVRHNTWVFFTCFIDWISIALFSGLVERNHLPIWVQEFFVLHTFHYWFFKFHHCHFLYCFILFPLNLFHLFHN